MRIGIDNVLGVHPQALQLRSDRTQLLARNIANADTPGFKARDINFKDAMAAVVKSRDSASAQSMRATHHTHLGGNTSSNASGGNELLYRTPLMPSLDGNTVDVQMEQTEFAQNSIQFLTSLRFVNGKLQGMLTAIKGE